MKEQKKIPSSKVQRATRMIKTGAKVGRNYIGHYAKKLFVADLDKTELNMKNAEAIYDELSKLKGGALKIAQMLSMDKAMLPREYTRKFALAQYNAPPLSAPLVVRTFRKYFGKGPNEIFEEFDLHAAHAASIGQVHKAKLKGKELAVKIQYPGIADTIKSDLRLVRPFAGRFVKVPDQDLDRFFEEVEERLMEECDYFYECKNSIDISTACKDVPNLFFAKYYPEYSNGRILTMDWLDGMHLDEFLATNPSQEIRNQIGQAMWDFINYQMHHLGRVHADPHPGNFLMRSDGTLGVLDFGCVKVIPPDFHNAYFSVIHPDVRSNPDRLLEVCYQLELLNRDDTEGDKEFVLDILEQFLQLVEKPFFSETFDFGDDSYLDNLYSFGLEVGKLSDMQQKHGGRGSKHAIYINRTFFGMFSMLNDLKAVISAKDNFILGLKFENQENSLVEQK